MKMSNLKQLEMKTKEQIKIKPEVKYLSDVMNELPKNCLFNKGATGAGGTTIALTEDSNTIIAVPFVSMIKSKVSQSYASNLYPYELFGLYGDVKVEALKDYLKRQNYNKNVKGVKTFNKIMVTYDSLPKLMKYIDAKDYNLLVDEYHILTLAYSFRNEAVNSVLVNYNKFKSYCFMTATPVDEEYKIPELKKVRSVECVWDNPTEVEFIPTKCKQLKGTLIRLIKKQVNGEGHIQNANLHLFVNSVNFIKEIIAATGLDKNTVRAVYGKDNKTNIPGIPNSEVTDPVKKINFYTSTVFEGCDIYDENGVTLIVSDASKEHSLLDISTQITQIAGRIRNSNYAEKVYHFFNTNKYLDSKFITAEEYRKRIKKQLEEEKKALEFINKSSISDKLAKGLEFAVKSNGKYEIEEYRIILELRQYSIMRGFYRTSVNVINEYKKNGLNAVLEVSNSKEYIKLENKREVYYMIKDAVNSLRELDDELQIQLKMSEIYEENSWLGEAIETLGLDVIEDLNYSERKIKTELKKMSLTEGKNDDYKVYKFLNHYRGLKKGEFISRAEAKDLIQRVYDELGIGLKAKATDLNKYYITEEGSKRIDGKVVRVFIVVMKKFD